MKNPATIAKPFSTLLLLSSAATCLFLAYSCLHQSTITAPKPALPVPAPAVPVPQPPKPAPIPVPVPPVPRPPPVVTPPVVIAPVVPPPVTLPPAVPTAPVVKPAAPPAAAPAESEKDSFPKTPFHQALRAAMKARGMKLEDICDAANPAALRILEEYGAVLLAAEPAKTPPACIFADEAAIQKFQASAGAKETDADGVRLTLQPAAMDSLIAARAEAKLAGLSLTPRNGEEAGRRSLDESRKLWSAYVEDGLLHWLHKGRLTRRDLTRIRKLNPPAQLGEVMKLEKRGLLFGLNQDKSILRSAAPPGCSQHLSLLALDVAEFADPAIREILSRHGWFQTVGGDYPHFTWLGVPEARLPELGLRSSTASGQTFWVPDLTPPPKPMADH